MAIVRQTFMTFLKIFSVVLLKIPLSLNFFLTSSITCNHNYAIKSLLSELQKMAVVISINYLVFRVYVY